MRNDFRVYLQVRDWVKPVPEDYMSISYFPSHPFVPWPRVSLLSLIPALFKEHLARSKEPSASVKSLVADYKKQKMLFMTSFPPEGIVAPPETENASQKPHPYQTSDAQPNSRPLSLSRNFPENSEMPHKHGHRS